MATIKKRISDNDIFKAAKNKAEQKAEQRHLL